jgi:hypothetical protein
MSKWFTASKLALYLEGMNIIKLVTNTYPQCQFFAIIKHTKDYTITKFLGLQTDNQPQEMEESSGSNDSQIMWSMLHC